MTLDEIKAAVRAGERVFHGTKGYEVCVHVFPSGEEQWLIRCTFNDYAIGLTWRDGKTMNGKPEEFFILTDVLPFENPPHWATESD